MYGRVERRKPLHKKAHLECSLNYAKQHRHHHISQWGLWIRCVSVRWGWGLTGPLQCGCAVGAGWGWQGALPAPLDPPHGSVSAAQTVASPREKHTEQHSLDRHYSISHMHRSTTNTTASNTNFMELVPKAHNVIINTMYITLCA